MHWTVWKKNDRRGRPWTECLVRTDIFAARSKPSESRGLAAFHAGGGNANKDSFLFLLQKINSAYVPLVCTGCVCVYQIVFVLAGWSNHLVTHVNWPKHLLLTLNCSAMAPTSLCQHRVGQIGHHNGNTLNFFLIVYFKCSGSFQIDWKWIENVRLTTESSYTAGKSVHGIHVEAGSSVQSALTVIYSLHLESALISVLLSCNPEVNSRVIEHNTRKNLHVSLTVRQIDRIHAWSNTSTGSFRDISFLKHLFLWSADIVCAKRCICAFIWFPKSCHCLLVFFLYIVYIALVLATIYWDL